MIVIAPNVQTDIVGRAKMLRDTLNKDSTHALPGYDAYLAELKLRTDAAKGAGSKEEPTEASPIRPDGASAGRPKV